MKGWRIDCNVSHYLIFEGLVRCYVSACASNRHSACSAFENLLPTQIIACCAYNQSMFLSTFSYSFLPRAESATFWLAGDSPHGEQKLPNDDFGSMNRVRTLFGQLTIDRIYTPLNHNPSKTDVVPQTFPKGRCKDH
jgi:hypothetical protein